MAQHRLAKMKPMSRKAVIIALAIEKLRGQRIDGLWQVVAELPNGVLEKYVGTYWIKTWEGQDYFFVPHAMVPGFYFSARDDMHALLSLHMHSPHNKETCLRPDTLSA